MTLAQFTAVKGRYINLNADFSKSKKLYKLLNESGALSILKDYKPYDPNSVESSDLFIERVEEEVENLSELNQFICFNLKKIIQILAFTNAIRYGCPASIERGVVKGIKQGTIVGVKTLGSTKLSLLLGFSFIRSLLKFNSSSEVNTNLHQDLSRKNTIALLGGSFFALSSFFSLFNQSRGSRYLQTLGKVLGAIYIYNRFSNLQNSAFTENNIREAAQFKNTLVRVTHRLVDIYFKMKSSR